MIFPLLKIRMHARAEMKQWVVLPLDIFSGDSFNGRCKVTWVSIVKTAFWLPTWWISSLCDSSRKGRPTACYRYPAVNSRSLLKCNYERSSGLSCKVSQCAQALILMLLLFMPLDFISSCWKCFIFCVAELCYYIFDASEPSYSTRCLH